MSASKVIAPTQRQRENRALRLCRHEAKTFPQVRKSGVNKEAIDTLLDARYLEVTGFVLVGKKRVPKYKTTWAGGMEYDTRVLIAHFPQAAE